MFPQILRNQFAQYKFKNIKNKVVKSKVSDMQLSFTVSPPSKFILIDLQRNS